MRNYSGKLKEYKLSRDTVAKLKIYCVTTRDKKIVHAAVNDAVGMGDGLHWFLFNHVTRTDWPWARLEANGIPCSADTFRIYRHKFYYCLNKRLNGAK